MVALATDIPEDDELDTVEAGPARLPGADSDLMATITKRQQARQQRIQQIYEAAEARLRAQPTGPTEQEKWLALAAALGRPTRTGTFGETVGNASEALLGHQQSVTKAQRERDTALERLRMGRAESELSGDDNLDKLAMQYLKPMRLAFNPVTGAAQNPYTGEEVKPPTGSGPNDVTVPTIVPGSDPRVGGDPAKMYTIFPARMGKPPALVEGQKTNEMETHTDLSGVVYQRRKGSSDPYTPVPLVGGDSDPDAESRELARAYGLPFTPPRVPTGMGKKARDAYLGKRANDGQSRLSEVAEDVNMARNLANEADKFMTIASRTKTGPAYAYMPAIARPADINALDTIAQGMIPLQPRTPGAISNFEAAGLGKSTLSPNSSPQNNEILARKYKALAQLSTEYQEFLDTWSQVHGGSIDGADAVWSRYLKSNPLYDPKRGAVAAPNPSRRSWKGWAKQTYYGNAPAKPASRVKIISVEPVR